MSQKIQAVGASGAGNAEVSQQIREFDRLQKEQFQNQLAIQKASSKNNTLFTMARSVRLTG